MVQNNIFDLISRDFSNLDSFLKTRREPAKFNPLFQFASAVVPQLATDIVEKENSYIYKINAPGFKKENLSLSIEDGILTVSLQKEEKFESPSLAPSNEDKPQESIEIVAKKDFEDRVLYSERSVTRFERQYQLPDDADMASTSAQFSDGVLEIAISKKQQARPQVTKIEIK